MISRTTKRFRQCFDRLPAHIQRQAVQAYRNFQRDTAHPSLNFKPTRRNASIYSARVTIGWRALGVRDGDRIIWFWIGSHAEYMRLIAEL